MKKKSTNPTTKKLSNKAKAAKAKKIGIIAIIAGVAIAIALAFVISNNLSAPITSNGNNVLGYDQYMQNSYCGFGQIGGTSSGEVWAYNIAEHPSYSTKLWCFTVDTDFDDSDIKNSDLVDKALFNKVINITASNKQCEINTLNPGQQTQFYCSWTVTFDMKRSGKTKLYLKSGSVVSGNYRNNPRTYSKEFKVVKKS